MPGTEEGLGPGRQVGSIHCQRMLVEDGTAQTVNSGAEAAAIAE